ncbi:MAG TPA: nuclear transport factor 2 family protein [Thermoplasmata archaeon]|nr:nuclear transport factor 2 family protein [Thermoplasmata archaeon]
METKLTALTEQDARLFFTEVNSRNVAKIVEQYAEDATFQVPTLEAPIKGKEAIRSYLTSAFAAFPDWTMDITKVIVSGDEAVVVNSVHGTHTGPYTTKDGKSIVPTNKKLNQEQLTRVVVNANGKVSLLRSYGNPSSMNRMLRPPNVTPTGTPPVTTATPAPSK